MELSVVTGHQGFIGKYLVKALQDQGQQVLCLPRGKIKIPDNIDNIYHLASYGNMYFHDNRQDIFDSNLKLTFDLLESCRNIPYKKFVYISSSAVSLPTKTLYSACKLACEALCQAYERVIIIRPYSVTGIGEQKEHLIPTLINAAYAHKEIPFVGAPYHDYIDVKDVVGEMIKANKPGIYHLGSGISYSNWQILRIIEYLTKRKIKIKETNSLRSYDNTNWRAPQSWSSRPIQETLKEMVNDYVKKQGIKT